MSQRWIRELISRPFVRITLAAALLIAGLAPVGAPILSDHARQAGLPSGDATLPEPGPAPFSYRWAAGGTEGTRVERSDDGGRTWHGVAKIPAEIAQLQAVRGDEQTVVARSAEAVWTSRDGGASWSLAGALPSSPLSLAVTGTDAGMLLVGTHSDGLLVSRDLGESWQMISDPILAGGGVALLAVNALAVDPADDGIVYASTSIWLGATTSRLTPIGTFVSVDGGQHWLMLAHAPLSSAPVTRLQPLEARPLTVIAQDAQGAHTFSLALGPELLSLLQSQDVGVRTSAARALGLLGDAAASPALLARLTDNDALAGDRAAEALGRLGDVSVVPALLDALEAPDDTVRARAALALGLLRAPEAVDGLAVALSASGAPAARRAAEALAAIGTPEALAALSAPLADADMTPARHAAMIGLELAGALAVEPLAAALASDSVPLRTNAAEMLGWIRADEATPALARALADADPGVRLQAAWALGEIGTDEARAAVAAAVPAELDPEAQATMTAVLSRASQDAAGRPSTVPFGEVLLGQVSQIPPGRWTLLVLTVALALLLLWTGPQQSQKRI